MSDVNCRVDTLSVASLPLLGLQHPTAEQAGNSKGGSSSRGVRRVTSGVKIN
jgi:hypothetical protein